MIRRAFNLIPWPWVRAVLPGVAISALGVAAFVGVLDQFLEKDDLYLIDEPLLEGLADLRTPWLTTTFTWITNAFGPGILPAVVGVACLAWALATRQWRNPALLVGAMVFSTGLAVLVKAIVDRPRPPEDLQVIPGLETSFSFPSGHTSGAATLILVLAYLLWAGRRDGSHFVVWMLASVAITGLVGASRMYLGYHFATDVLAGASLGVVTLGLVVAGSRLLELRDRAGRLRGLEAAVDGGQELGDGRVDR